MSEKSAYFPIAMKIDIGQGHKPGARIPHGGHAERPAQGSGTSSGIKWGHQMDAVACEQGQYPGGFLKSRPSGEKKDARFRPGCGSPRLNRKGRRALGKKARGGGVVFSLRPWWVAIADHGRSPGFPRKREREAGTINSMRSGSARYPRAMSAARAFRPVFSVPESMVFYSCANWPALSSDREVPQNLRSGGSRKTVRCSKRPPCAFSHDAGIQGGAEAVRHRLPITAAREK